MCLVAVVSPNDLHPAIRLTLILSACFSACARSYSICRPSRAFSSLGPRILCSSSYAANVRLFSAKNKIKNWVDESGFLREDCGRCSQPIASSMEAISERRRRSTNSRSLIHAFLRRTSRAPLLCKAGDALEWEAVAKRTPVSAKSVSAEFCITMRGLTTRAPVLPQSAPAPVYDRVLEFLKRNHGRKLREVMDAEIDISDVIQLTPMS
jgi:hypothetical protein